MSEKKSFLFFVFFFFFVTLGMTTRKKMLRLESLIKALLAEINYKNASWEVSEILTLFLHVFWWLVFVFYLYFLMQCSCMIFVSYSKFV